MDGLYNGMFAILIAGIVFALVLILLKKNSGNQQQDEKITDIKVAEPEHRIAAPLDIEAPQDNSELVAAITAAIAAYLGTSESSIMVRSIVRQGNLSGWNSVYKHIS